MIVVGMIVAEVWPFLSQRAARANQA